MAPGCTGEKAADRADGMAWRWHGPFLPHAGPGNARSHNTCTLRRTGVTGGCDMVSSQRVP